MSENQKEFYELLLANLRALTQKVDDLQEDMSEIKSDVAVLKETKETVRQLNNCIEKFEGRLSNIDKEVALKTSKWSVMTTLLTMLAALLVAYLVGAFNSKSAEPAESHEFNTRGYHPPAEKDTTPSILDYQK